MHLQGPVPLDDDDYIARPFENNLIRELLNNRWALLLGPRQHGKTSGLIRVREMLKENGIQAALVDLQRAPPSKSYSEFIRWVCQSIRDQLHTDKVAIEESESLDVLIAQVLPEGNSPVAVLFDEASNIPNTAWRNSFYGQLRAISSQRAYAQPDSAAVRLRFVFSGTFRPETLIDAANSPFNVCERIVTDDLTEGEVTSMTNSVLGKGHDDIGHSIFAEVGGHPFLMQKLLSLVKGTTDPPAALDAEISDLRLGESDHIAHLFGKILAEPKLAQIVSKMVQFGSIAIQPGDHNYSYLQISGVAKRDGAKLIFRNSLYQYIATNSPQFTNNAVVAEHAPIFAKPESAFANVADNRLREIAWSAHSGAVAAYKNSSNRLALAGFGSSLEAMLIDMLSRQQREDLAKAASKLKFNNNEDRKDPYTWRLVNLINAARRVSGSADLEPPHALREWRNTIHPAVSLQDYHRDSDLGPEVRTAAAMHEILLRDLP